MDERGKERPTERIKLGFGIPSSVYTDMIYTSDELQRLLDVNESRIFRDPETGTSYLFLKKEMERPSTEKEYIQKIEDISAHILETVEQILRDGGQEESADITRDGEYWRVLVDLFHADYKSDEIEAASYYPQENRYMEHVAISRKPEGKFVMRVKAPTFKRLRDLWILGWSNLTGPFSRR